MIRRTAAIFILSTVVLTACGSRPVVIGDGGSVTPLRSPDAAQVDATGTVSGGPSPFPTETPRARGKRPAADDGLGFGSGPGAENTMPLSVRLSRECVQPGQEMSATAVTLPSSKLAFAAAYSDNDIVPDFTYTPSESNPTGTFTWTWVIRPTIPPGEALVSVVAAKDDRGATFEQPFRVARSC